MGGVAEPIFLGFSLDHMYGSGQMMVRREKEEDGDEICSSSISISSSVDMSSESDESSEEVTSSSGSPTHMDSSGPLYELSSLMSTLPIKRGLSKYFQGKSQSFTSLARVTSVEDLAKKEIPYKRKMKSCKSYAGGLDCHKATLGTKSTITKKPSRGSCSSLLAKRSNSLIGGRPPMPLQKS